MGAGVGSAGGSTGRGSLDETPSGGAHYRQGDPAEEGRRARATASPQSVVTQLSVCVLFGIEVRVSVGAAAGSAISLQPPSHMIEQNIFFGSPWLSLPTSISKNSSSQEQGLWHLMQGPQVDSRVPVIPWQHNGSSGL